jgi:hypothetical protein
MAFHSLAGQEVAVLGAFMARVILTRNIFVEIDASLSASSAA